MFVPIFSPLFRRNVGFFPPPVRCSPTRRRFSPTFTTKNTVLSHRRAARLCLGTVLPLVINQRLIAMDGDDDVRHPGCTTSARHSTQKPSLWPAFDPLFNAAKDCGGSPTLTGGHASTALRRACAEAVRARLARPQVLFSVLSSKKPYRESFLDVSLFQKHGILD